MSAYPPARGLRQCDWLVTGDVSEFDRGNTCRMQIVPTVLSS